MPTAAQTNIDYTLLNSPSVPQDNLTSSLASMCIVSQPSTHHSANTIVRDSFTTPLVCTGAVPKTIPVTTSRRTTDCNQRFGLSAPASRVGFAQSFMLPTSVVSTTYTGNGCYNREKQTSTGLPDYSNIIPSIAPASYSLPANVAKPPARPNIPVPTATPNEIRNPALEYAQHYAYPSPPVQIVARELPVFSGDPEDWPLFYSAFKNTSQAYGLSDADNTIRLQRCLRGNALEAVRSKLLIPAALPMVIETLRQLYGRPEILVHSLIRKVRDAPAPRSDKLESLISFGLIVQNLKDHLEAAQQQAHLNNPTLLFELVEKLPDNYKMDWALYKQQYEVVDLRHFAQYMSVLTKAASDVTIPAGIRSSYGSKAIKNKERHFVYAHDISEENEGVNSDQKLHMLHTQPEEKGCKICSRMGHKVRDCEEFRKLDVNERWELVNNLFLCRNCLFQHGRRPCKLKKVCGVQGCQFKHHSLLHVSGEQAPPSSTSATANYHRLEGRPSLYRILPITLHSPARSIKAYAFLDDGSSITLIENSIADALELDGAAGRLCLSWTADITRDEPNSKWVSLEVSGESNSRRFPLTNIRTVQKLSLPVQTLKFKQLSSRFPHLAGLPVSDYDDAILQILIGNDNAHLAVALRRSEGKFGEPIATRCRLGWVIHGPVTYHPQSVNNFSLHICNCSSQLEDLHKIVKQSFTFDSIGISNHCDLESAENQRARDILEATTKKVGARFETGLLWKYDNFELPDSYNMALKRNRCLERRMKADPIIGESVARQIMEYQQKGYLIKAKPAELKAADPRRVWYLPLGFVVNPKKPGKVRIFCDAAAKVNGISLNTMLLKGPDLLVLLPKILSGFRERKIAVCADIREMFHRVFIRDQDVQAQRILWRSDPDKEPETYFLKAATFGAASSPCSVQYVKNLNARQHAEEYPDAAISIIERHYMDDYLESFDSPEKAIERALEVKLVHAKAGFEIHSWSSNSTEVLEAVGEKDPSAVKKIDAGDSTQTERILGMLWLRKEDAFTYSSNLGHVPEWPTKREVLRVVMSLYDPLGLLSHFTIHGRVLIQDVWRSKKAWDEKVPEELQIRWLQWVSLFNQLNLIRIPRQYFPSRNTAEIGLLQLHVFVDASESAYACAAYLRSEFHDKVSCVLVTAKSRVAPLKTVSIPRLELQAAVVGSRLMEYVEQTCSLNISRRIAWTDSQTVLAWINSDVRKYNQYVSCRVGEILEKTNASDWRWVSSKHNVADEATKWGSGPDLSSGSRWWSGPSFLYDVEEKWPTQHPKHTDPNTELKIRKPEIITVHHVTHGNLLDIKWERFSQWNRLVHALGYVHRYFNIVLCKAKKLTNPNIIFGRDEYLAAERLIFRTVQKETYPEEIEVLVQSSPKDDRTLKRNSPLAKLSPFLDEHGIMRMETRISAAAFLSYETRNPIILPRDHRSTKLLVLWYHAKSLHQNTDTVINEVRQRFHVPRLRSLLRQVQKECMHCNVYKIKPVVPRMSPLPTARLGAFFRPFSFVGLDYFGPLTVKIGRSTVKRWVALYTCLTIRAIHLEVVHSLTTISCKMAMRRFVARRGSR
ncbi:uncharacterized protein LOC129761002 [Uranotaenia lowii]|uniref:uncharacterized protein LOC129761002 n=1 Tax=Uranotaenia lowii TaxID=190385 RepID=UPI00247ACD8D|nr:uncharacterized protein LOC129761002 [Uranotaenia lowii]